MKTYTHECTYKGVPLDLEYSVEDNYADLDTVTLRGQKENMLPMFSSHTLDALQQEVELDWSNRCADPRDSRED